MRYQPLDIAFFFYCQACHIILLQWQFDACIDAMTHPETLWNWGRGMSKTFLLSHIFVFLALRGLVCYYYAPSKDQLKQITFYWRQNPFVSNVTDEWVYVVNSNPIQKKILTNKRSRSGRCDVIAVDEEAAIEKHQEAALDAIEGQLSHSKFALKIRTSTPILGTRFEQDNLRLQDLGRVSWHNWTNTQIQLPNGDYIVQPSQMLEQKIKYIRMGMYWKYEVEYLALWRAAGGTVFKNLIIEPLESMPMQIKQTGTDFHGDFGAVVIGCYWQSPEDIYITHEHRYEQKGKFDYSFFRTQYSGCMNHVEGGGFNDGYAKFTNYNYGTIIDDNNAKMRSLRLMNLLNCRIHLCPDLTPLTYDDIRSATWESDGSIYVKDEQHPDHYLDAFVLAGQSGNVGGIWGHHKSSTSDNVVQSDKLRQNMIRH